MKASQVLLWVVVAAVSYLVFQKLGLLSAITAPLTSAPAGGTQSVVPKSDFQVVADDISGILGKLLPSAQTAPKTT